MLAKLTREGKVGVYRGHGPGQVLSAPVFTPARSKTRRRSVPPFNTGRSSPWLADVFRFEVLSPEGFEAGAKYLLKRGYR